MKIKAILFDMDGVLIEAKDWHYHALNQALELFGMPISRYDHLSTYDGLPTKKKLEMLTIDKNLPKGLHPFIERVKQQYTIEQIYEKCRPSFNHEYALSRLKTEGYHMAVCSNSIRSTIELMMEKSALRGYLEFIISNQDVSKSKPDPEMYILGIKKMGLTPKEVLIVEDNPNGIKAAIASGGHVMQVQDVHDVTYQNIIGHIQKFEAAGAA